MKGKYFVSKGIQTTADDTLAEPKFEKHRLKFEASKLDSILNAMREKRIDFDICAGDSVVRIELNDKMDIRSYVGMTHRTYIDITYKFTTTSVEFSITDIVLDDLTVESMAGFSVRSKHLNLHMML